MADSDRQENQIIKDLRKMFQARKLSKYYTCSHSLLTKPPYSGVRVVLGTTMNLEQVAEMFLERFGCSAQRIKTFKCAYHGEDL